MADETLQSHNDTQRVGTTDVPQAPTIEEQVALLAENIKVLGGRLEWIRKPRLQPPPPAEKPPPSAQSPLCNELEALNVDLQDILDSLQI